MTFGEWLKQQLYDRRLSNAELARRVQVSATHIGNLANDYAPNTKSGIGRPSLELTDKIARALGASKDEARLVAGYAPEQPLQREKPQNVKELLERLEELGIDEPIFKGGVENLPNDPDVLDNILKVISTVVEIELRRTHTNNASPSERTMRQ